MEFALALSCAVVLYTAYVLYFAFYQIYFHPLANFPGPKWAAVSTQWHESTLFPVCWTDSAIERLHKKLGPVVRIGENELHIDFPSAYPPVFKVGSRFLKDPTFYDAMVPMPTGSIAQIDPVAHRMRRALLGPAFSQQATQRISPVVEEKSALLCKILEDKAECGHPVNLSQAFRAFTMDITAHLIFGKDWDVISAPGFHHNHISAMKAAFAHLWLPKVIPLTYRFLRILPYNWRSFFFPPTIVELMKSCRLMIERHHDREEKSNATDYTILGLLLDPPAPARPLSDRELEDEILTLMIAGNDTTANVFIQGIYLISSNPGVCSRLYDELATAKRSRGNLRYEDLTKLPYLTATIKEVLRLSSPLPGRLPRVVPHEGYQCGKWYIPGGTAISISSYILHRNETVFRNGREFEPERWLADSNIELSEYFATFSKGSRQCLGLRLAWCELYVLLATFYLRFEVKLTEDASKNIRWRDNMLMLFHDDLSAILVPK